MTRISILFSALTFLVFASPSHALTFNFSFDGIQGTISGLEDNSANQAADSFFVAISPIGGEGEYVPSFFNDFTVSAGVITFAEFIAVDGNIVLSLIGGNGIFVTDNGVREGEILFASPSETPVPGALPLFATGLSALGLVAYRRRRKAA